MLFTFQVPGMFPGFLERSLEATYFQILTAIVGQFTKKSKTRSENMGWLYFRKNTYN